MQLDPPWPSRSPSDRPFQRGSRVTTRCPLLSSLEPRQEGPAFPHAPLASPVYGPIDIDCASTPLRRFPLARSAADLPEQARLPAVMRERLVGVGHLVHVLALLDRVAATLRGFLERRGQALDHGLLATLAAVVDQPAHRQGDAALRADLDGHLVGRATDAAALDLDL